MGEEEQINLWYFIPGLFLIASWLYIVYYFSISDLLVTNLPDKASRVVNILIWGAVAFVFIDLMFTKRIVKGGKSKDGKKSRI